MIYMQMLVILRQKVILKLLRDKLKKIKNLIEKVDKGDKQYMESRLSSENWIKKLIDNQIYLESNYYTFDEKILTISIC